MFVKGKSGNPNGRPKLTDEQREANAALNGPLTKQAIKVLADAMAEGGAEGLKAAINVLERSLGKPAMAPDDREALGATGLLAGLTVAELLEIAKQPK